MTLTIDFGKETRLDLIQHFINKVNCKNYLEIGCDRNQIWDHINVKNKFGVDPRRGGNIRLTSDEFFEQNKDNNLFDVIFIDGLHTYDQVSKDVEESETSDGTKSFVSKVGTTKLYTIADKPYIVNYTRLV